MMSWDIILTSCCTSKGAFSPLFLSVAPLLSWAFAPWLASFVIAGDVSLPERCPPSPLAFALGLSFWGLGSPIVAFSRGFYLLPPGFAP